jgi:hypothetical protein
MRTRTTASGTVQRGATDGSNPRVTLLRRTRDIAFVATMALLLACGEGENRSASSIPSRVDGVWELSLQRKGTTVRGRLTLHSEPADTADCRGMKSTLACETAAAGTHSLQTRGVLPYDLPPAAGASLLGPDSVLFMIGGCCDRGEISGLGRWKDGAFHGRWADQRIAGTPIRGTFTLRPMDGEWLGGNSAR